MKKFLLSIFAVMLAVFSVQAQKTAEFKCGNDITATTANLLDGKIQMSLAQEKGTSAPAYNVSSKELRLYYSKTNSGQGCSLTFAIDETITITGVEITASSSSYTAAVNYFVDGGSAKAGNWTDTKMTISGIEATKTFKIQNANTSNKQLRIKSIKITYEENANATPTLKTPQLSENSCFFYENEPLEITIISEEGASIYYTLDGSTPDENANIYSSPISITKTTTLKAIAIGDGYKDSDVVEATYRMLKEGEFVDVLTREVTNISSGTSTYKDWADVNLTSSAVYAGNSAGSNDAIQLRNDPAKGYAGIITTNSGGKAKKIVVVWRDETTAGRILDVYGKNTKYSAVKDLYSEDTRGTKLGSIKKGTSTELVIEGDYEYIGLISNDGAMYLASVEITWVVEEEEPVAETWSSFYAAIPVAIPEGVEAYIVTAANAGYVTLTQIYNAVPAYTGVILKGGSIEVNYYSGEVAEVTGNLLQGTMASSYISEEAYVLGCVDGEYGFYKAAMNQQDGTAWLANGGKAYLPVKNLPKNAQGAASFSFRFGEGTTGVENVVVENELKAIFDLTGRCIEKVTAPGIYIVNGKKVLVK